MAARLWEVGRGGSKGRKRGPMEEGSGRWGPEGAGREEKEDPEVKEALSR